MTSSARNINFNQDSLDQQHGLDIDAHSHNLAIDFVGKSGQVIGSNDGETFEKIRKEITSNTQYKELSEEELDDLAYATLLKFNKLLNLKEKEKALEKEKTGYSKFEKERFVRSMSTEIPEAANDNAGIKHKIKRALGLSTDLTRKTEEHYKGIFSAEAANDVETIKENDALRDDSYFQARTLARIQGNLRELENESLISDKSADKLTAGFDSMREKMKEIASVIDDYEKILVATADYDPNNSSRLETFMYQIDSFYYGPTDDRKYTDAYLSQASLEKSLMSFENSLRKELGLDLSDEVPGLREEIPPSRVELMDFQQRQTRISELTAGIEELIKQYRRRNAKSIEAQKKNLSKDSDRIKKEKSAAEKRAEKWEDVRANEVMRVFWYEFGNHVVAIKQHKANLARISAKGRAVYETHLEGIMSEYLSLREEVQAFEEAMELKGFMVCLDAEFGQIKVKNSVIELSKVRADLARAKVKMEPKTNHKAPPMPDIEPPEMDDMPDSGTRKKKLDSVVDDGQAIDVLGNDNSIEGANNNKANIDSKLPEAIDNLFEAGSNEVEVLNSDEKKAQEEAQKAAEGKAIQEEAQRLAEAASIAAEKAKTERLALDLPNEIARKEAEEPASGNLDKVIKETKGEIVKNIETKEVLIPAETLYLGDLHGNYKVFEETVVNVLKLATKRDDGNLVWIGGNRKFNDLGDIVFDRVTESFSILRQIRNLRKQAVEEGGRVEVVAGNHEDFAIGFFMGGVEMFDAFINAMRADYYGNRQGAGIYEFFAKYTKMGKHHSQYDAQFRDKNKTASESEASLWKKLDELQNYTGNLEELDGYRKEILANMANDAEGLEILEEMARLNLVLADDGVSISIHTEPTNQILASLTLNTNERAGVEKNVEKLNAKFKTLLKKLFLGKVDLSNEERAELNQLRSTFIYTDNRNFKRNYQARQIDTNNLKALAEAGYKTIVHGHTDLEYAISFGTAEGINIVNVDRSVGKTAGTGVDFESSTAVMYKDGKIETGLQDYTNLEKFNYTTKATADWLKEVFSLVPEASVSVEAQKLTDEIGATNPEKIGERLNKDALKYLISTFAVGNEMDDSQKLPLKADLIKSLVDLYHEWIADDLKAGEDIKKIVAEMVALKAPIGDLAARWRAKKVKDQEKPTADDKGNETDNETVKADMEVKDDTVVYFSPTKVNKLYNQLNDPEHTQNQIDALAAFSNIFGKLSKEQIKALADAIDALDVLVQKRIVYNIVNFTSTINTIFTGEMNGVRVFGAVRDLPKNVTLFEALKGLEAKSLDILKDTTKLEKATRALNRLNGKTIVQIKKMVKSSFKSKTVLEWLAKLK